MLNACNLAFVSFARLHGNLDGDEFGPDAERLIAIGRKPVLTHLAKRRAAAFDS